MAVPEQTPYKEYTANGTTNEFPTTFDCESKDHLIVMVDDDEVEASTWQFIKNSSNLQGSIKFNHAPANGLKITIQRNSPARRESQYSSYNNSFRPQAINEDLDRVWRKVQELVISGVLLKGYVDRQDNKLSQRIDSLNIKVDQNKTATDSAINAAKQYSDSKNDQLESRLGNRINQNGERISQNTSDIRDVNNQIDQIRTGATLGSKVYKDTAEGLANTKSGDYFSVRSSNDDSYIDEYWNEGGVAVPTGKSYPSSNAKWRTNQVINPNGLDQETINNQIKTPLQVAADSTGSTDATVNIASLLDPSGKHVIQMTKGVYLVDSAVIPPNTIVYANGAIFKRRRHTDKPTVIVSENSVLFGAFVDGNKDALGAGTHTCRGVDLRRNSCAIFCHSYNNARHGFYAVNEDLMIFNPRSENQKALFCKSYNNGFNPGGGGTGDGFSAMNSDNVLFLGCESWNNARTGFVATTYDRSTTKTDKSYSKGVRASHCKSWDNGYSDYNFEGVDQGRMNDIEGGSVTYSFSANGTFNNIFSDSFYAQDSDNLIVNNVRIETDNPNSTFLITGKTPNVSNVDIKISESADISNQTSTVQILSPDDSGCVSNIHVNRAHFGVRLGVADASNIKVDTAVGGKILVTREGNSSAIFDNLIQLSSGRLEINRNGLPTSGYWKIGDIIYRNDQFSRGNLGYVCVTSGIGSAAKWANFGNVGAVPQEATFLSSEPQSSFNANDFTAGSSYYAAASDSKTYINLPFELVDNRLIIDTKYSSAIGQGWLEQTAKSVLSNKRARRIKGFNGSWTPWELI